MPFSKEKSLKKQVYKALAVLLLSTSILSLQIDYGYSASGTSNTISVKSVVVKKTDKSQNSTIDIEYPQIDNIKNPVLKNMVNQDLKKNQNDLLYWFNKNVSDNNKQSGGVKFIENNQSTLDIRYEKIFVSDKLLSINVYSSSYFYGSAHPNSESYTFNYDLTSGSLITFADIFKKNSGYLNKISDYCMKYLIAKNKKEGMVPDMEWLKTGAGPKSENFKYFNLTDKNLMIVFQDYQVTSHADGPPTITIPLSTLKSIINPKYL